MTAAGTTAPRPRELAITRVFDAPRELVWKAWTDPERLSAWWGPRGWSAPVEHITIDARPGGAFRVLGVCDADGRQMPTEGVYREVVAPERLVFEEPGRGTRGTLTLTDLGGGRTEMRFETTLHTTAEVARRARRGLSSAFDRLAEQLP